MDSSIPFADLAIVGGGAAGLASAIFAAEAAPEGRRIVILDRARMLGAKILISGGGRCNVTHEKVLVQDFNGSRNIVRNILAAFDADAAVRWFAALGVELKREQTGKLFPVTDSARTVLNALLRRCEELSIAIQTDHRVTEILPPSDANASFTIEHERGRLRCRRIIMCTGGRSLPRSGSDGGGWEILRRLGHSVTQTYPALVPLVLAPEMFHKELAGISQEVTLMVMAGGKRVDSRTGSLLWTHFGVSGPVVMDASRHWVIADETDRQATLRCNLLPGDSFETAEGRLIKAAASGPKGSVLKQLAERMPDRVAGAVLSYVGIEPALTLGQLSRDARRAVVHALTDLVLPVAQPRGWNYAEVTAGGVPLHEIDYRSMQSRKIPGLYLAGEVLDCDGRIGGFNFQWAWCTGHIAGRAAAATL